MQLILDLNIEPFLKKISYKSKCLFIGSCFTEQIGNRFSELKFRVIQNPNGIIYDPLSIAETITRCTENSKYNEEDLFFNNELWHSWKHHSRFSGTERNAVLSSINEGIQNAHDLLKTAEWLVITFGSSFYYELKQTKQNVANCHKIPAAKFDKKLLTREKIVEVISNAILQLRLFNPAINIVFTISPVRHIKDGIIENNLSKSRLIDAVHTLKNNFENSYYFPAYELVTDVLRDYRFFEKDMVHPNAQAADFVFEKFCEAVMEKETLLIMDEIKKWTTAENHRPFNTATEPYKNFKINQQQKLTELKSKYPFINF